MSLSKTKRVALALVTWALCLAIAPAARAQMLSGTIAGATAPGAPSYVISVVGGTTQALNLTTGHVDSSSTDAAVVFHYVFETSGISTTGGAVSLAKGVYNCNSLQHETTGGNDHYYCLGIPANLASNIYGHFIIQGEGQPFFTGNWTNPGVPTNGTIINITSTAISSVTTGALIVGIWARPDAGATPAIGNQVYLHDFGVRFPTNQRGNTEAINLQEAEDTSFVNVTADFAVVSSMLAPATKGTVNNIAFTAQKASKGTDQYFRNTYASGWDIAYWVSELADLQDCTAYENNTVGVIGGLSANNFHPVTLIHFVDQDNINGWTISSNVQAGLTLYVANYDLEYFTSGTWARGNDTVEATAGQTRGVVTYTTILSGAGTMNGHGFWKSGSGANVLTIGSPSNGQTRVTGLFQAAPITTVSALPTCNTAAEGLAVGVSDAASPTFLGTLTGGGSTHALAYCNGTAWIAE